MRGHNKNMLIINNQEILRQKSVEVLPEEIAGIVQQLEEELALHPTGVGLSACQIGIYKQVSIIRYKNKKYTLINPKMMFQAKPEVFRRESCLSFPGIKLDTVRFKITVVKNGDGQTIRAHWPLAVILQHEMDHLDGVLFFDRVAAPALHA